jgi:hypothetical protein
LADEITTFDTKFWISIHGYVLENWWWILVLLNLEKVIDSFTIENIRNVMLWTLVIQGGFTKAKIGKKLVSIGTNGGSMFAGCKIGVLVQMKEKLALYLVAMRCCAHCTNLTIQTFSSLSKCTIWKICCNPFIPILQEVPRKCLSCRNLQLFWTPKVIKSCGMLKPVGFPCCLHASKLQLNTRPSLQRC